MIEKIMPLPAAAELMMVLALSKWIDEFVRAGCSFKRPMNKIGTLEYKTHVWTSRSSSFMMSTLINH